MSLAFPSDMKSTDLKHLLQAVATPFRAHPAAALWDEVDGLHLDQFTAFLWRLKLATSSDEDEGAAR